MKKVLSVITCSLLAACSCSDNQWEEVDVVTVDEPVYEEKVVADQDMVEVTPARVVVEQEAVYTPAPQPVSSCPCAVQVQPCYQSVCYQPCPCMMVQPVVVPQPQPKVTTTKKIITTTTTVEEPCGKDFCEPVVTTHEEVIPAEVRYMDNYSANTYSSAPVSVNQAPAQSEYVEVTVEKDPYRPEVLGMQPTTVKKNAKPIAAAKYSPEAYNVVATRATNRMLQDTANISSKGHKTVFLKDTQVLSSDMPYGSERLKSTTKDIINVSKTFDVVNSPKDADYIVASTADWYVADSKAPALQYKLSMFDKSGRKVNEWVEIIRQVQE